TPGKRMSLMMGIVLASIATLKLPHQPDGSSRAPRSDDGNRCRYRPCRPTSHAKKSGQNECLKLWHEGLSIVVHLSLISSKRKPFF
ncbi:MAG: hypothetical protein ABI865_15900, partial [Nitrosospira sp.]